LKILSPDEQTVFIKKHINDIATIIRDRKKLDAILRVLGDEQKIIFIEELIRRLSMMNSPCSELVLILKALPLHKKTPYIPILKNHIAIIKTPNELLAVMQTFDPLEQDAFEKMIGIHIPTIITNSVELKFVWETLVCKTILIQNLGDRIETLITDLPFLIKVLNGIDYDQITSMESLKRKICTLIPDRNTLVGVCEEITVVKIKEMIIEIFHLNFVKTGIEHQQLVANLTTHADLLNSLKQNLVYFEWNDASDSLHNLQKLFTPDSIKVTSDKKIYEKIQKFISALIRTQNSPVVDDLELNETLTTFFDLLLEIDNKNSLPSPSQKISFFASLQTPLDDMALRMQFALKKLEEKRLALASEREEAPFDPARVILSP
jgi:hypothetical protein